ncbi:MAG: phage portal protein [Clostridiales bacterium]|nr:phage portal protein [Clostridiales bacterium]
MLGFDFTWVKNIFTIQQQVNGAITDEQFIVKQIQAFLASPVRRDMLTGERYYRGIHDILWRKRLVIGEGGELEEVKNLPNARIVDNQYKKMVKQKNNYLLGQPLTFTSDDNTYNDILQQVFNKSFMKTLKNIGKDSLNCGIGWLFLGYEENGELQFKRFKPYEVIPGWADADHTILDYVIRIYEIEQYTRSGINILKKVEIYTKTGIHCYTLDGATLKPDDVPHMPYFYANEEGYNWERIPLIAFKYGDEELPLIKSVKSLQDGINLMESTFENNMQEDSRNTVLVLVNYDGENLGEFRRNLAQYGAVKVRTMASGGNGGIQSLQVEVNAENYKAILELFKKALIENAMGFDAKDDRLSGNPNQMNIMSMYSDIDLDANDTETEYQAAMEQLLWFVNAHISNMGMGDYDGVPVTVTFNRDMLMNESDIIDNCQKSVGILADETIIANHPWVDDPQAELDRLKAQKEEEMQNMDSYHGAFKKGGNEEDEDTE